MKRIGMVIFGVGLLFIAQVARADWSTIKRLAWTSGNSFNPAIAVDSSGNPHVVWNDSTPGNYEVYYKKSSNGGTIWTTSQRLTFNSGISWSPAIAVGPSANLHLVWTDSTSENWESYYKKSSNGGISWTTSQRLTWNSGFSTYPSVAVDSSGNPHVVWEDSTPGNYEVYYKKSSNGGAVWTAGQKLTSTSGDSGIPAVAVDSSGNLHVVWTEETSGNAEIYYKKSSNGGTSWTTGQRLTWTSGYSTDPSVAVDSSGNLHVVWTDDTSGHDEIYYKKGSNGGAIWTAGQKLTSTSGASEIPSIAVDSSGDLHLVWGDDTPGNYEIYYKKGSNGGANWTASQRITWTMGFSGAPSIVIDPADNLHLVWYDSTPGNYEIYYRKGT